MDDSAVSSIKSKNGVIFLTYFCQSHSNFKLARNITNWLLCAASRAAKQSPREPSVEFSQPANRHATDSQRSVKLNALHSNSNAMLPYAWSENKAIQLWKKASEFLLSIIFTPLSGVNKSSQLLDFNFPNLSLSVEKPLVFLFGYTRNCEVRTSVLS